MLTNPAWAEDRYRVLAPILERRLATAFARLPRASVQDAAQHAWEQLLRKPPAYFADRDPLPWLFVVARNALRGEARRRPVPVDLDRAAPEPDLDAALEVRAAFAALTTNQRTALTCRALGLRYREACRATGRTYTWINRHVTEGRRALRTHLRMSSAGHAPTGERAR